MADESQHKESENHARIRMERQLMQLFGATRSEARKALRRDAEARNAANLSARFPAAPAIGGQQFVDISEAKQEVHRTGDVNSTGATGDAGGGTPSVGTITTVTTVLLVSGVFQYWNLQGTYISDV